MKGKDEMNERRNDVAGFPQELTAEMLNALIEKIVVHEAEKDEIGMRVQDVDIYYRFVGKIA